jgi:hypothetical protein
MFSPDVQFMLRPVPTSVTGKVFAASASSMRPQVAEPACTLFRHLFSWRVEFLSAGA